MTTSSMTTQRLVRFFGFLELPCLVTLFVSGCNPETQPPISAGGGNVETSTPNRDKEASATDRHAETDSSTKSAAESIGMQFKRIEAGEFRMGSEMQGDGPVHLVRITKDFHLGITEVTQGQWEAVMNTQPWKDEPGVKIGSDFPATNMTWTDAVEFCKQLSEKDGVTYRLPTGAEWEYACRAGTTTTYSFGDDAAKLTEYAWFSTRPRNAKEEYGHQVGTKLPNPWGLFDMHGNVSEWCLDTYYDYPSSTEIDPVGPAERRGQVVTDRVVRGGDFKSAATYCRASCRYVRKMTRGAIERGFRVARGPVPVPPGAEVGSK